MMRISTPGSPQFVLNTVGIAGFDAGYNKAVGIKRDLERAKSWQTLPKAIGERVDIGSWGRFSDTERAGLRSVRVNQIRRIEYMAGRVGPAKGQITEVRFWEDQVANPIQLFIHGAMISGAELLLEHDYEQGLLGALVRSRYHANIKCYSVPFEASININSLDRLRRFAPLIGPEGLSRNDQIWQKANELLRS